MSESPSGRAPDAADPAGAGAGAVDPVRPFSGGAGRKERGGFNPDRLGEASRPSSVIPKIVGGGQVVRATAPVSPPPLVPPASPAQRVLQERDARAEPQGYTDVRIIGVGGGGGNAVNRMIEAGVQGVEFVVVNTDAQSLDTSPALRKIQLSTHGSLHLGAGGDPDVGRQAAEASESVILDAIGSADMVFVTAGMGGGTGTGGAPVVAQLARRQHALTVGVVTLPFTFEGARRRRLAAAGVDELWRAVDALIVVPNDRLLTLSERNMSMVQAFRRADDLLRQGVQGIADLVTVTGTINLDFADVRSVMEDAGRALMAVGEGSGENRALGAAQSVVSSPLLEHSIAGASRILLNITGGPDLTLHEVSEIADYVTQAAAPDVNIIFGHVVHPRPEVEVRVTLIATGMPQESSGAAVAARRPPSFPRDFGPRDAGLSRTNEPSRAPAPDSEPPRRAGDPAPGAAWPADERDGRDVPPFLRRQR